MKSSKHLFVVFGALCLVSHGQDVEIDVENSESSSWTKAFSGIGNSDVDFEVDGLFSSDIKIIQSLFSYEKQIKGLTLNGSFGHTNHDVDYTPTPGTGGVPANNLNEDTFRYSLGISGDIAEGLNLSFTGSYTDGFADHRSLWISEFNTNFLDVPGFRDPNPESYSFSLASRWDYAPGGSLESTVSYSKARIVPLAAIDPDTFSSVIAVDEQIDTYSGSLAWRIALNKQINSQHSVRFVRTEGRELRTQLQSEWAVALSDSWILRGQIGAAKEQPTFEAIYGGLTLIYELGSHWQFDLGLRYYEDTGEINTENFNTAAPGIVSTEASLGVLWKSGETSVRLSAGIFDSDFDPITNPENRSISNLYRDREFIATRFAVSHAF